MEFTSKCTGNRNAEINTRIDKSKSQHSDRGIQKMMLRETNLKVGVPKRGIRKLMLLLGKGNQSMKPRVATDRTRPMARPHSMCENCPPIDKRKCCPAETKG